jgi:hypothetical protein
MNLGLYQNRIFRSGNGVGAIGAVSLEARAWSGDAVFFNNNGIGSHTDNHLIIKGFYF